MFPRAARQPVEHPATLIHPDGRMRHGTLSDVSIRGARFTGRRLPPPDAEVEVDVEGLRVPARVAWTRDDATGLEFLDPMERLSLSLVRRVMR